MKIALYHGFTDIHFEMLGYFLEYIKYSNVIINIYSISDNIIGKEWKEYYEKLFNINLNWINLSLFNPYNYDLIILLTDDDKTFKEEWLLEFGKNKVICIDHCGLIRRDNMMLRIGTRFFNSRPNTLWALPCYFGINKINKNKILEDTKKISVLCIGIQNRPPFIEFLQDLFENFNDLEFHIIARFFDNKFESYKNIYTYELCSTEIMFDLAKKSQYILCLDNPNNSYPIANSMSGAIPISFSYGCQLILPSTWNQYYNFKSCITYNDNFLQKNGHSKLNLSKNINLDKIYDELYDLVFHRNKVFDSFIKESNKVLHNWQSKIIASLNYPIPNIIININQYIDSNNIHEISELSSEIKNYRLDFREIHYIHNNININSHYIYSHNNLNIIIKLNDSVLFNFENTEYDKLIEYFNLIGQRNHKDIIILNNNNNINYLLQIYNRHAINYNFQNKIIIISQR